MSKTELKPCPFCGAPGEAHEHEEIPGMWIAGCSEERGECIGVMAAYDFVSRETAVAAWNKRPIEDALQKAYRLEGKYK